MVLFGRNGESPVPVVAASTPSQCFDAAIEAVRIALKYRTPVYLLSDAYLANGSEPWLIPDVDDLPDISTTFAEAGTEPFEPYLRDPETLARPWAIPGHARPRAPDRRAREGGRHGSDLVRRRQPRPHGAAARAEGRGHRRRHPGARGRRPGRRRRSCSWSAGDRRTGPIQAAVRRARKQGARVAHAHLHYLNPFPRNTGDVLRRYPKVLVPEMNLGPARDAPPRRVPRRRRVVHARPRPAADRGGARGGDHGDDGGA